LSNFAKRQAGNISTSAFLSVDCFWLVRFSTVGALLN